ncbi:MAG: transposase [Gammaproteobacteria bacterium CG11_big_fil_rev_8_21_14_0_20_46_22]|nr:MAG: transposase [Gammaproteobacteria bacterium CG12_big_fil_rev_8_21_14_0_65_46_12]PIR11448.1 MAG: transposase [Gammaproteobacteria bacterium CG11_big_fil_rev_8_21_14_0_20_46_22]
MKIKLRKRLSAPGLLEAGRLRFSRIPDSLAARTKYPLADCLMSALAMFSLKYPSLLQFDHSQEDEKVRHNLKTLYGVDQVPSDTYMRERLDPLDPERLQPAFKACFSAVQRGKQLPLFSFLDDYYLVSNDGTGMFYSENVHCENCCIKKHRKGGESYYHQMMCAVMVHPRQSTVLPMTMEPILKQDGVTKNDCERNSSKRLLTKLRCMHPKLKMVIVEDALHSNAPHISLLKELGYQYIIGVKPDGNKWLFDWVNAGGCQTKQMNRKGFQYEFRWFNDAPLNASHEDLRVNFFECKETSPQGKTQTFTWITGFHITEANVYELMKGARARWKIENETFNTLKTQGYHFEHNYGHGYQNLSTVLAYLMMLAFLIDQIQQLCCPQFQAALKKCKKRTRLWERIRHWFLTFFIDSWEAFFQCIATPPDFRLSLNSG